MPSLMLIVRPLKKLLRSCILEMLQLRLSADKRVDEQREKQ